MKAMAFQEENHKRYKVMVEKTTENISSFILGGINVPYCLKEDISTKLSKFLRMCGTI
jgi:hypothetical protein